MSRKPIKKVPERRQLVNSIRNNVSPELNRLIGCHFAVSLTITDTCSACQGCVAICPTGALSTGTRDGKPDFSALSCTGCGLCSEFCLEGALQITGPQQEST